MARDGNFRAQLTRDTTRGRTTASNISSATAEAALEKLLPDISAIDDDRVKICQASGVEGVATARQMTAALALDRLAIAASFAAPPLALNAPEKPAAYPNVFVRKPGN